MNKKLSSGCFIIVFIISLFLNAYCQQSVSDMNLIGNVSSLKEISFKVVEKNGAIEKGEQKRDRYYNYDFVLKFAPVGMMFEDKKIKSDGTTHVVWKYEKSTARYTGGKKYENLKQTAVKTYKYDSSNNLVKETEKKISGEITFRIEYLYNNSGQKNETIYYNKDNEIYRKLIYKYNENGNVNERITLKGEETVDCKIAYKYDSAGNEIMTNFSDKYGESITYFKYDQYGNITERLYTTDGSEIKSNNTYEYDSKGNWIKKIQFEKGKPLFILERTITYY